MYSIVLYVLVWKHALNKGIIPIAQTGSLLSVLFVWQPYNRQANPSLTDVISLGSLWFEINQLKHSCSVLDDMKILPQADRSQHNTAVESHTPY